MAFMPSDAGRRLRRLGFAALAAAAIRRLGTPEVRRAGYQRIMGKV